MISQGDKNKSEAEKFEYLSDIVFLALKAGKGYAKLYYSNYGENNTKPKIMH